MDRMEIDIKQFRGGSWFAGTDGVTGLGPTKKHALRDLKGELEKLLEVVRLAYEATPDDD